MAGQITRILITTLTLLMGEELCMELNANILAGQICNYSKLQLTVSVLIAFLSFIHSSKNGILKGNTRIMFILALKLYYACILLLTNY